MAKELIDDIDNDIIEYFLNVEEDYLIELKEKRGYEDLKETLRRIPLSKLKLIIQDKVEQNEKGEIPNDKAERHEGELAIMCEAYSEGVVEQDIKEYNDYVTIQRLIELEKRRKEKEIQAIMKKYDGDITKTSLFDRGRLDRIEKRNEYLNKRQNELDEQIKQYPPIFIGEDKEELTLPQNEPNREI